MRDEEWDDDDDDDWEEESDDEPVGECPYCGEEIHEQAEQCPECGKYISEEDAPPKRKPWWIIVGALLVMYIVYRWIMGG